MLQEIKELIDSGLSYDKYKYLEDKHIEWLIKQAELLQSHAPEGRNYTNAQYVELRQENERLKRTNQMLGNIATADVKKTSKDHPYGKPSTFGKLNI